ncbi:hypothetical protein FNW02_15075 [Komarekiella sp. 'clone 1']|uniref:Uncharacterized protein n=1 Tax=Komarekiella delphini-convector SJRDD-AB1 TaxID=2593771 RepID=A0AA40SXX2_9NOST|nr:hypothetical protein [Komarekiella delphini-convector SJRDD-AB1]
MTGTVLTLAAGSILVGPWLEAEELEGSGNGIRSEFIKTPCGGDTSHCGILLRRLKRAFVRLVKVYFLSTKLHQSALYNSKDAKFIIYILNVSFSAFTLVSEAYHSYDSGGSS